MTQDVERHRALAAENESLRGRIAELELEVAAQRAAAERQTAYAACFDALPIPIVLYRPDGTAVAINRANELLIATPREAIVEQHNIFHDPEALEKGYATCFRAASAGTVVSMPPTTYNTAEARLAGRIDDRLFWSETTYFPIPGPDGEMALVGEINLDVTERVVAEAAERRLNTELLERERRFRALFDRAGMAIGLVEPSDRMIDANPAMSALFGVSYEELVGQSLLTFTHPEDVEPDRTLFAELLAGRRDHYRIEKRYTRRDGAIIYGRLTNSAVRNEAGRVEFVIRMVEDVTAQRAAERERQVAEEERLIFERRLRETQKLESLGLLAGGIAHDFNNLLVAILGNASVALEELPAASPARHSLSQIELAARRAAELTRQLLAYAGKGRLATQTLQLNTLVQEMAQLLYTSVPRTVALRYDLEPELPPVEADATQLRQVIMNLVINGAEAMGDQPGMVTVSSGILHADHLYLSRIFLAPELPSGTYVVLAVTDSGRGMDRETLERIFEPFFTTKFTGRGLGLAAVLGIVRGHHGAIKVYSEPGRGSTFRILLPAVSAELATADPPAPTSTAQRYSGLALVVDDEGDVRTVATMMLERLGFTVMLAADGATGLALFRERSDEVALALLDITMPGMGGEDLAAALRALRPDARIVLMSGYSEHDAAVRAGPGLQGFLPKPFTMSELAEIVRRAMG